MQVSGADDTAPIKTSWSAWQGAKARLEQAKGGMQDPNPFNEPGFARKERDQGQEAAADAWGGDRND
eukprot:7296664-Alexandrium_andersonii.AAC.1